MDIGPVQIDFIYCAHCGRPFEAKDLIDGKCPHCGAANPKAAVCAPSADDQSSSSTPNFSCAVSIWLLLAAFLVLCTQWLVAGRFVTPHSDGFRNFYDFYPWLPDAEASLQGPWKVKYYALVGALTATALALFLFARSGNQPPRPWQRMKVSSHVGLLVLLTSLPLVLCSYEATRPVYGAVMFRAEPGTSYGSPDCVVRGDSVVRRIPSDKLALSLDEKREADRELSTRSAEATICGLAAAVLSALGVLIILWPRIHKPTKGLYG